jgi:outer membrane receptor for ferrienterochelin and colicins
VREQLVQRQVDQPRISGTYSSTSAGGSIFNANAALEFYEFRLNRPYEVDAVGQPDFRELRRNREDEWNFEIGADYEFGLGSGRLKLIGFQRYEHSPLSSFYRRDFSTGAAPTGQRFDQTLDEGESVVRAEYRWKSGKADWQISAEGAYNFLDSQAELFQLNGQGGFDPAAVPNANSRVEEKRGQLLLSYGRPLSPSLSLQSTVGGEYSMITQSGANGLSRQFFRPKGFVTLAWNASPRLSISTKLERKVHQLNFFDFIASVDVQNSNDNAGNPQLVPPQSWLLNVEANRSLGAAGSIKVKIDAEAISDIVDRVPIGPTQEAPGNLPSAQRLRGEIIGSFVLDAIGFRGAKLDTTLALQTASLRDPLTGEKRPISDRGRSFWSVNFRHDIPDSNWAWGFAAEDDSVYGFYRLDYFGRNFQSGPLTSAFVEHKDIFGLKVRAGLSNLTGQNRQYREIFWVGRRDGPVDFTRDGRFGAEMTYSLAISGTF